MEGTGPGNAIYVVNHGKHAGLMIRRADIPANRIPERADFPGAEYLEIGWGERDYYQADDPGVWLTLKAALWPTASVLHVVGVSGTPRKAFAGLEVLRVTLNRDAFSRLVRDIDESFVRMNGDKALPLRRGQYGDSWFYPARGRFHIFNTCNGWIADKLKRAGLQLGWVDPFTSDQLMAGLRRSGVAVEH
ncbi:MAG: DUF2459 domain-containing protein [Methylohalobius sp. ZOD2]